MSASARQLSEADMAACVAYVDGQLPAAERIEFELRMAAEPELAAAAEALLSTDTLLRELGAGVERRLTKVQRARPWLWAGSLALAAAALIALAVHLLAPRAPAGRFEVAVAPSFESAGEFIDSLPELAGLRPPGLDPLRGEVEQPNVSPGEFARRAAAAEGELVSACLRGRVSEVTAGFFVVPLELSRESRVVIYAFPRDLASPQEGVAPLFAGTLPRGRHVLPAARFSDAAAPPRELALEYQRGFLVPIGAGQLEVVVGVGAADALDPAAIRFHDAGHARRELEASEFGVAALLVREPAD